MASLTGGNAPVACGTDPTPFSAPNPTTATAITKAWALAPGTPQAGTVYQLDVEFTGTFEANAMAFQVNIGGVWTQMSPAVAATAWSAGTVIAGWLSLRIRVLSATQARFALAGAVSETATSVTPSTGSAALAPLSQTLTIAAGSTITLGVLFGASNAAQGLASYGSHFLTVGAQG